MHDTLVSRLLSPTPAGAGTGSTDHTVPFQRSTSGAYRSGRSPEVNPPTATHEDPDGHEIPLTSTVLLPAGSAITSRDHPDRSTGPQTRRRGPRKGTDSRWQRRYTLCSRNTTTASSRRTMEPEAIELTSPMCRPPKRSPAATPVGMPPPRRRLPRDQMPPPAHQSPAEPYDSHPRVCPGPSSAIRQTLRPAGHTRQRTPQARGRPGSRRGLCSPPTRSSDWRSPTAHRLPGTNSDQCVRAARMTARQVLVKGRVHEAWVVECDQQAQAPKRVGGRRHTRVGTERRDAAPRPGPWRGGRWGEERCSGGPWSGGVLSLRHGQSSRCPPPAHRSPPSPRPGPRSPSGAESARVAPAGRGRADPERR